MRMNVKFLRVVALLLLLGAGVTGCERADVSAPSDLEAQFNKGNRNRGTQVRRVSTTGDRADAAGVTRGTSQLMQVSGSGANGSWTHYLYIPEGAVRQKTNFTMELADSEVFHVELTATKAGSRSSNDVGASGFQKPLLLCLDRKDASITDLSKVAIAEVLNGNFLSVPTTAHALNSHVCGQLRHFSGYTMIED